LKHKSLAQEFRMSIYSYIAKYESHLIDSGNTGCFFRGPDNKFISKTHVGHSIAADSILMLNQSSKAELLQKVLSVCYAFENDSMPPQLCEMYHLNALTTF